MARVLFPPPDPQDLGTTRKSAAASKNRLASSLHTQRGQDSCCGACRPSHHQGHGARATPIRLTPHQPGIRSAQKERRLWESLSSQLYT